MIFSLEDLINQEVNKHEDHKVKSWNASKLGSCLTGIYLERLGVKPDVEFDNRTLRVFSAGKIFESWVTELIHDQPGQTVERQVRVEIPELDLTGYADLVVHNDKDYIY